MQKALTIAALRTMLTSPIGAHATGLYSRESIDSAKWLTKAELTAQLEASGWSARRMKEDSGCWEVYGTDTDGQRVEGYFHPTTGAAKLIAQRGRILFRANDQLRWGSQRTFAAGSHGDLARQPFGQRNHTNQSTTKLARTDENTPRYT